MVFLVVVHCLTKIFVSAQKESCLNRLELRQHSKKWCTFVSYHHIPMGSRMFTLPV